MRIRDLEDLPWYVKPPFRLIGFILWLAIAAIGGPIIFLSYLPIFILFGHEGFDWCMEIFGRAWETAGDLMLL